MTSTLTPADFCQGHGGGRDCTYDFDSGECRHGVEFDHGIVSYCDGTCPEAREHFLRHLRLELHTWPQASPEITLAVWGDGVSYEVVFEGPRAEDRALNYLSARKGLHFSPVEDRPFSFNAFPRMEEMLFPTCHHGLALELCMDPVGQNHFGTLAQEQAMGW